MAPSMKGKKMLIIVRVTRCAVALLIVGSAQMLGQEPESEMYRLSVRAGLGITFRASGFQHSVDFGFSFSTEISYAKPGNSLSPTLLLSHHSLIVDPRVPVEIARTIKATNWKLTYVLVTPKLEGRISTGAKVYWLPLTVGVLFVKSPTVSGGPLNTTESNSRAPAIGLGLGFSVPLAGAESRQILDFGIRFIHSEPRFNGNLEFIDIFQTQLSIIFM